MTTPPTDRATEPAEPSGLTEPIGPTDPARPDVPPSDAATVTAAPADVQAAFAATLVDEWVRAGLCHAVVCPGSRSTPLALALASAAADRRLRLDVHHDERSAGFLALGVGLASGRPAVVLTTSGTAAAELHPAVVEADLAAVPLLVCTADRPPELRDVGAPQAIDQVHLYGRSARWYADPGVPDGAAQDGWRAFASHAYAVAFGGVRPGPVHLNLPFREPLVGEPGELPSPRADGGPWVRVATPGRGAADDLSELASSLVGRRGIVVAGAWADVGHGAPGVRGAGGEGAAESPSASDAGRRLAGAAVHATAAALGWPVVAEPRSPAWQPADTLVPHLDAILRSPRAAADLRPEVIVRLGPPGASRVVNEWLAASGAVEVVAGAPGWSDPSATAAVVVDSADALVTALDEAAADTAPAAGWFDRWRTVGVVARRAAEAELAPGRSGPSAGADDAGAGSPTEPVVARAVVQGLVGGTSLVVSSSMPIRDVERYAAPRGEIRVVANRGANGIDGVVSTAVGVALGSGRPAALLIGDVAFLHDSNGLLGAAGRGIDLVCVVVDNDGGGIFSFLPQARSLEPDRFETLFGTPHGLDLVAVATAYGIDARRLDPREDVTGAVAEAAASGGVRVLVVPTDRAGNVDAHRRIDDAVADAVEAALEG